MKKVLIYIIPVSICLLIGFFASQLQSGSIETWYPFLNKPPLTPPNYVFPVAWTILYICMGISIGLIIDSDGYQKRYLTGLFAIQLILNFLWSVFFFYLRNPLLGLIDIILLEIFLMYYAMQSHPRYKLSSILFIPYILWVGFATYLNLYIYLNN